MSSSSLLTKFPADGLHNPRRYIVGYEEDGLCHFVKDDHGDHHSLMVNGIAAQNIVFSTKKSKVDLNGEADIRFAMEKNVR